MPEARPTATTTSASETHEGLRADVAAYYTEKVVTHGPTARGVDWNSTESQLLRFEQLLRLIPAQAEDFSVLDFGCGYGAFADALAVGHERYRYQGFDLSSAMIDQATQRLGSDPRHRFTTDVTDLQPADYVVASGVFNVKLHHPDAEWRAYMEDTVDQLARLARSGFAFNALTSYSDPERQRPDLHYADPLAWFDRCKRRHSRFVTLLHDYPLYEFTLLVTLEPERR